MADIDMTSAPKAQIDAMKEKSGAMMEMWQGSAARMMRANERVMHGFITAAKLEIELGKDLMARRMEVFKTVTESGKAEHVLQSQYQRSVQEMEHIMETMRAVSTEMRDGFSEAAKLLFENAPAEAKQFLYKTEEAMTQQADLAADKAKEGFEQTKEVVAAALPKTSRKTVITDSEV
jgi:uncharacterized protein YukE